MKLGDLVSLGKEASSLARDALKESPDFTSIAEKAKRVLDKNPDLANLLGPNIANTAKDMMEKNPGIANLLGPNIGNTIASAADAVTKAAVPGAATVPGAAAESASGAAPDDAASVAAASPSPSPSKNPCPSSFSENSASVIQVLLIIFAITGIMCTLGMMAIASADKTTLDMYDPTLRRLKQKGNNVDAGILEFQDTLEYAILIKDAGQFHLFGTEKSAIMTVVYMSVAMGSLVLVLGALSMLLTFQGKGSLNPKFEPWPTFKFIIVLFLVQLALTLMYYFLVYRPADVKRNEAKRTLNMRIGNMNNRIMSNLYYSSKDTNFYTYLVESTRTNNVNAARKYILETRNRSIEDTKKMLFTYNLYAYFNSMYSDPKKFKTTDLYNAFVGQKTPKLRFERYFNVLDIIQKKQKKQVYIPNLFTSEQIDLYAERTGWPTNPTKTIYAQVQRLMDDLNNDIGSIFGSAPMAFSTVDGSTRITSQLLKDFEGDLKKRWRIWVGTQAAVILVVAIAVRTRFSARRSWNC